MEEENLLEEVRQNWEKRTLLKARMKEQERRSRMERERVRDDLQDDLSRDFAVENDGVLHADLKETFGEEELEGIEARAMSADARLEKKKRKEEKKRKRRGILKKETGQEVPREEETRLFLRSAMPGKVWEEELDTDSEDFVLDFERGEAYEKRS